MVLTQVVQEFAVTPSISFNALPDAHALYLVYLILKHSSVLVCRSKSIIAWLHQPLHSSQSIIIRVLRHASIVVFVHL